MGKTIEDDDLTPDEREALQASSKPDDKDVQQAEPAEQAADAVAVKAADKAPDDGAETAEAAAPDADALKAVVDDAEPAPTAKPFVPMLDGKGPENYAEQRKTLRDEISGARNKWSSGELSDDEFTAIESAAQDKLEALMIEHTTAVALQKANQQIQAQARADIERAEKVVIDAIRLQGKDAGIDYADAALAKQFDGALGFVEASPQWANRTFADQAAEAHRMVLTMHGKAPAPTATPAAQAAATEKPAPKQRDVPRTLAGLPTAAASPVGNDLMTTFGAVSDPDEAEAMLERMPAAQRSALLRSSFIRPQ